MTQRGDPIFSQTMSPERMQGSPDKDGLFAAKRQVGYFNSVGVGPFRLKFLKSPSAHHSPGANDGKPAQKFGDVGLRN